MLNWLFGSEVKREREQLQLEQIRTQREALAQIRGQMNELKASYYEAAEPRSDLWELANATDADASLRSPVRRAMRNRYRYEKANNPVVNRINNVYVDDLTGPKGPALVVRGGDRAVAQRIQQQWQDWWTATNHAGKLHTIAQAISGDGEAIGKQTTQRVLNSPVQLSTRLFECDRLEAPTHDDQRTHYVDGVHLDGNGNPVAYDILHQHPGNQYSDGLHGIWQATTYPANQVYHVFRTLRPEQHRGLSPWSPALPTMGELRKFLQSTRQAAQIAASLSVLLETDLAQGLAGESITLPTGHGNLFTLPESWKATQMKAEHPSTTLEMFYRVCVSMGAGSFSMPTSRAMGWAISGSYAVIRGLLLPYSNRLQADRAQVLEPLFLNPLLQTFLMELYLADPFFAPIDMQQLQLLRFDWRWPRNEVVVDPSRDATAKQKQLAMGEITRDQLVESNDLDAFDRAAAVQCGYPDTPEGVREYRRQCFANAGKPLHEPLDADAAEEQINSVFELVER